MLMHFHLGESSVYIAWNKTVLDKHIAFSWLSMVTAWVVSNAREPFLGVWWCPFKKKKKLTWSSSVAASAIMSTMMLPTATVNSQPACSTDFILLGACGAQGMTAFRKNLKTVENVYYVFFFFKKTFWGQTWDFSCEVVNFPVRFSPLWQIEQ